VRSPPGEGIINRPLDSDLVVSSDRECELDQVVATPASDATFSADGEITPANPKICGDKGVPVK
jgi:hypothetical protein